MAKSMYINEIKIVTIDNEGYENISFFDRISTNSYGRLYVGTSCSPLDATRFNEADTVSIDALIACIKKILKQNGYITKEVCLAKIEFKY